MGWGKGGKGKGWWGPGYHHHRGPNPGVVLAEAAAVGVVAGVAVAAATAPRPKPKPRPYQRGPEVIVVNAAPVGTQEPAVVVAPAYRKGKGKGKWKGKGKGKGPVVVVDSSPPLGITSIGMNLQLAEIRGINYFYAVDVMPESGAAWRVKRCYTEFEDLFSKLGRPSFPAAPFPQSLEKLASGDGRYDFGIGIGRCTNCQTTCKNRGDKETRTVYCSTCYPKRFPDSVVLQTHHRQLEAWLQGVIQHPSSHGPWKQVLRGFLEAGREFLSVAPANTGSAKSGPAKAKAKAKSEEVAKAPTAPAPKQTPVPAPMPASPETTVEEYDEQGETISIEIPPGVTAGQIIAITVPSGRQVQFTVPEGQKGGDTLNLWYDSVANTLSPIDDSEEHSEDQTLSIEVPAGVTGGQIIAITVPDGRQIQLTVPEGKQTGDKLDLWFDSAEGTLTPMM